MDLDSYLSSRRETVDRCLDDLLPPPHGPAATVRRAMRYAVLAGGKRLRPILAIASCAACGGQEDQVLEPAAALELIHTYSLVHDDLPCMDDDDLRRGRATVHREFGEAEAVLAGDALLTLGLEILAAKPEGADFSARRAEAVVTVARAAGVAGMVGGQMADLEAEREPAAAERLEWIHRHKTAVLLAASAELGGIHAGASPDAREGLRQYGLSLGLAFQIADDILDRTSTPERLGKTPGKDVAAGKSTYPALYGIEGSRREASRLVDAALEELAVLGPLDPVLEGLARFAASRSR